MLNQIPSLQLGRKKCSLKSICRNPFLNNRLLLFVWVLFVSLMQHRPRRCHGFSCFLAVILTGFLCSTSSSIRIHKERKPELSQICVEKFISTSHLTEELQLVTYAPDKYRDDSKLWSQEMFEMAYSPHCFSHSVELMLLKRIPYSFLFVQ